MEKTTKKIVAWNIVSLTAALKYPEYKEYLSSCDADIFCLFETKLNNSDNVENYFRFLKNSKYYYYSNHCSRRQGYSGVLLASKQKLNENSVFQDLVINPDSCEICNEGRLIGGIFDNFVVVGLYVKNAGEDLKFLQERLNWDKALKKTADELKTIYPNKIIIICGDLNVCAEPIDIYDGDIKSRGAIPGFSPKEIINFNELLKSGWIDTYRYLYNDQKQYTFWTYRGKAREQNKGWRLDYFLVDEQHIKCIKDSIIRDDVKGSDHCPIELIIDTTSC